MKYTHIVGLGYNCEISFRIKNALGKLDAQLFSWSLIVDRSKFLQALQNPKMIFSGSLERQNNGMYECQVTKIRFHPRYDVLRDETRKLEERDIWCQQELRSRIEHLREKHQKLMQSSDWTLFLMKVKPEDPQRDIDYIQQVYQILKKQYVSGHFVLVAIVPILKFTSELRRMEDEHLKIRTLKWYAPQKHTDVASDSIGWAKIFKEFLGVSPMAFYKNVWKQRLEVCPGMVSYKIFRILRHQ